jgi:hypothetical protein
MSVLPGHEDLKPKTIVGFDNMGFALVQHGADIRRYKLFIGPGGALGARPAAEEDKGLPDQLIPVKNQPLRHHGVDQM